MFVVLINIYEIKYSRVQIVRPSIIQPSVLSDFAMK